MAKLKSGTTIAGSTAWHAGNDGASSGLDADLLDGDHGSAFAKVSAISNIDMNGYNINDVDKVQTQAESKEVKFAVYSGDTYGIGMVSGVTFGSLNDWAMTFVMNNESDRGFWWGYSGQSKDTGAMALTTGGILLVKDSIRVGFDETTNMGLGGTYRLTVGGGALVDGPMLINDATDKFSHGSAYSAWSKDYVVNNTTPGKLTGQGTSTSLNNGGVYKFHAHISGTGTDNWATAVAWNQNGTWRMNVTGQSGNSSNHPQFQILSDGTSNVPHVVTEHSTNYTIHVYTECLELFEGLGTDNWNGFGADGYMSSANGVLKYNPYGHTQTGADPYNGSSYYTVWHSGNDGTGSGLDADKLDGLNSASFLRSDLAATSVGLHFNDNKKATFGNTSSSPDLEIYHNGTNGSTYMDNSTGNFYIQNSANDYDVIIQSDDGSGGEVPYVRCDGSTGQVILYNYGSQKASTSSNGFTVSGYLYTNNGVVHNGDTDTFINFTTDRMQFYCGNLEMLDMVEGTTDYVDIIDRVRVTSGGDMICEGDITAFTTTAVSDERRKDNIKIIDNALDKVAALKGVTFNWKHNGQSSAGLIAQDVEKVLPDVVMEKEIRDEGTYKTVDYDGVIGLLVESIKELKAEIEVLKNGSTN